VSVLCVHNKAMIREALKGQRKEKRKVEIGREGER
jgi:hypothetical protein